MTAVMKFQRYWYHGQHGDPQTPLWRALTLLARIYLLLLVLCPQQRNGENQTRTWHKGTHELGPNSKYVLKNVGSQCRGNGDFRTANVCMLCWLLVLGFLVAPGLVAAPCKWKLEPLAFPVLENDMFGRFSEAWTVEFGNLELEGEEEEWPSAEDFLEMDVNGDGLLKAREVGGSLADARRLVHAADCDGDLALSVEEFMKSVEDERVEKRAEFGGGGIVLTQAVASTLPGAAGNVLSKSSTIDCVRTVAGRIAADPLGTQ